MKFNINRIELTHSSFSLLYTFALYVACNIFNLDKIVKWFLIGEAIDYWGLTAYLVFGYGIFLAIFMLFAHRWIIKPVAIFFIIVSAAIAYFISKYNVAFDRSMLLNVVHTDLTEAGSFLSIYMLPYVFFLVLVPVFLLSKVQITFQKNGMYLIKSCALFFLSLGVSIGALYFQYNSIHRAANLSHKYILYTLVPVNFIQSSASVIHRSVVALQDEHKNVPITAKLTQQDDLLIVLAIGESSRKKSFSLYGYDRKNTTPALSEMDGLHLLTGNSSIGTTILALRDLLDREDVKLPAVTSKVGIDTSCYVNYKLYDNCDAVGEISPENCGHGGKCYDEDVIPLLVENLKTYDAGYRFVILHLGGGSHGPNYHNRHPPEFQKFKPLCLDADMVNKCTKEEIYNSYDNTILYVDYVVSEIIKKLDTVKKPYVFIYLSDHGESLLEEGRIFHGMPPGVPLPPEQKEVPLIIKSSVPITIDQREAYPLRHVYDTVLDLFSIDADVKDEKGVFIKKN